MSMSAIIKENDPDLPSPSSMTGASVTTSNSANGDGHDTPGTSPGAGSDHGDSSPLPFDIGQPMPHPSIHARSPSGDQVSTHLLTEETDSVQDLLRSLGPETRLARTVCCGGGCCRVKRLSVSEGDADGTGKGLRRPLVPPQGNEAFDALKINLSGLSLDSQLTGTTALTPQTVSFTSHMPPTLENRERGPDDHCPVFLEPHAPYKVYRAPLGNVRELTKPGAEKRTFHFELDVTDYPEESGNVDFVVGGAVGTCPANSDEIMDEIFDCLGILKPARDKTVTLHTTGGRWPTIWGDEKSRDLLTSRRELLRWCSDVQSYPPTKQLLRVLAEYASDPSEKKILTYLCSAEGQAAFCDMRTASYITLPQLLKAFRSSQPPLEHLFSVLPTLMPRFYSLSHDPLLSKTADGKCERRTIEFAVALQENSDYRGGRRYGVGSGFLSRLAFHAMQDERSNQNFSGLHVPIFRGLMANPLAREFTSDGPMILIGAGVGIAPFRGFVQRRLKSANCVNKVWVLQGVRDSLLDELYSGEWGVHEDMIKRVVQSRVGEGKYVQEEVRNQADLIWFVINALDGRVYVCGSSKGMAEGVEESLVSVGMRMGGLNQEAAMQFWMEKKASGHYISETW